MRVLSNARPFWAALLAFVIFGSTVATAGPAQAGPDDPLYLAVTKTVTNATPDPGEPFTYTIRVTCSEASCLEARLDDALPVELAGYTIDNASYTPSAAIIPRTVTWDVDGASSGAAPSVVTADTALSVDFTGEVSAPPGIGLQYGQTFTVMLTLSVPADLPPGTTEITNTANTTAENSSDSSSAATITVTQPERIAVDVTKAWTPGTQTFQVGKDSAIALSATNTSNIPVDSMVVQEPQAAVEGATVLDASNPFTIKDFDGFSGFVMPTGASTVQVDAYVFDAVASTWGWVVGTAEATPALPLTVTAADVGGLRFTYAGGAIVPAAVTSVTLNLVQRATDRTGAGLSAAVRSVINVVQATAIASGFTPAQDTASATHTINPATVRAETSKSITPSRIAAGSSAVGRIIATNASDVGVAELRAADLDFFTDQVTFGGFTIAPTWPATADSAEVIYHFVGGAQESVSFGNGDVPGLPLGPGLISGFEVVFTSSTGNIGAGTSSVIEFDIVTTEAALVDPVTGDSLDSLTVPNRVDTTVEALNGLTDSDFDTADLLLLKPAITITLDKVILPRGDVAPGERVVTSLRTQLKTTSDYVTANKIVVEDAWDGSVGDFWDAFSLDSVAPTQVLSDTSLEIQLQGPSPAYTWVKVKTFDADEAAFLAHMTRDQLVTGLSDASAGFVLADVTGVRFTFENSTLAGFANDTIVMPYVTSRARDTLRNGVGQTAPVPPGVSVAFNNAAVATGYGQTKADTPTQLTATATDTESASIKRNPGIGTDGIGIRKAWTNSALVPAQSGANRSTLLSWSVNTAYQQVVIADPENPTDPTSSVFEAFDLKSIASIPASDTPFSNGWYLKYDTIDSVQLYNGTAWVDPATVPAGGWINAAGRFVGYNLTALESGSTTGVRITLRENATARAAAIASGSDPYAPEVGSGVAWSSNERQFRLTWQLRNKTRPGNQFVTHTALYNTGTPGLVDNTVQLDATPVGGGATVTDRANASIQLQSFTPGVKVVKTVTPVVANRLYVPMVGTTPAENYPNATFTVTANSTSFVKASYVRVMDSPVCTDGSFIDACQGSGTAAGAIADPFPTDPTDVDWLTNPGLGNPFNRFDLRDVNITASDMAEVDLSESVVWLLLYGAAGPDIYSTEESTALAVNDMTPAELATVVGISVTFQGTDPAIDGGSISSTNALKVTLLTKLRTNLRDSGDPQTVAANVTVDVKNRAFAQSYDPVLNDNLKTGALGSATTGLTGGDINVAAVKSISPAALTEPTRNGVVTVTIGANPGSGSVSSLPPAEVRLTDYISTSPDFWNQFRFTGLGTLTAPAGSDQVVVSVYGPFDTAGAMAWVSNPAATPIAGATVPVSVSQFPDIQGVRLAFSRADGAFFSSTVPAATWTTSSTFTVLLRDTYRDSGDPVELTGSVDNTVSVISDRLNGEASEVRTSADQIGLSSGTYEVEVNKLANGGNRTASAGESVPWDLTFTNSGTGFLTITELRDTLPVSLVYLGDTEPTYTPDPSGTLPEPVDVAQVGNELVFTWPTGDRTMSPGETFSLRLMLELQPGLAAGERGTNEMTVTTAETLATCANIESEGMTTGAFAANPSTCGTTDYVTPSIGPNLFTVKGVRGSLPGATNPDNAGQECVASLTATGGSYFRAPCAANSVIGGVDEWVLRAQNAGTTGVEEFVLFDALPNGGDRFLISGGSRGSAYRPQMVDDLDITAPVGTDILIEVSLSPEPCVGTWADLEGQEPCEQNTEVWTTAGPGTDWSVVTAFRITLDFDTTDAGMLSPGDFVDVTFSSRNAPATAADPSGASVDVPVVDSYAWNQFGVKYLDTGATAFRKIAPARMGIHLLDGELQIDKVVAGVFANLAPSTYAVDLECTVEGVPLNMGDFSRLELRRVDGFTRTVPGLPSGSDCLMTESDTGMATVVSFAGVGVEGVSRVSASVAIEQSTAVVTLTNSFDEELAFTGVTGVMSLLVLAIVLIAMGGAVLAVRGRRRLA